jgi:poly-gamma-glutamate synthesis protein (capsule biosynthesis protein)
MHENVNIYFLGDISFNDAYVGIFDEGESPFKEISPVLAGADYVVGNLECTARGTEGFNTLKKPYQYTEIRTYEWLKDLHLDLACMANNHFYDNLQSGLELSIQKLDEYGIAHTGLAKKGEKHRHITKEIKGARFAFLNYVARDTNPKLPDDAAFLPAFLETKQCVEDIQKAKQESDFVVLFLHWGGRTDYGHYPHHSQRRQARAFARAGADLIVGCHTHTFQASEHMGGKPVYYSLGNFCYADIIWKGRRIQVRPSGKRGGILQASFDLQTRKVQTHVLPIVNEDLHIRPEPNLKSALRKRRFLLPIVMSWPLRCFYYHLFLKVIEPKIFAYQASERNLWQKLARLPRKLIGR